MRKVTVAVLVGLVVSLFGTVAPAEATRIHYSMVDCVSKRELNRLEWGMPKYKVNRIIGSPGLLIYEQKISPFGYPSETYRVYKYRRCGLFWNTMTLDFVKYGGAGGRYWRLVS